MRPGYVETAPIREAVELSGLSFYEVAQRLGWASRSSCGRYAVVDTYRLKRRLGVTPYWLGAKTTSGRVRTRSERKCLTREMKEETALAILDAVDVAPVDVGL